jgi:hypothetical protein
VSPDNDRAIQTRAACLATAAILPVVMLRVLLGILKGAVIGGAIGYGASRVGLGHGATGYLIYAGTGFLVGLVCGKAIWRQETLWTPALKGLFGAGILSGLYWGATKVLGHMMPPLALPSSFAPPATALIDLPQLLAPALAVVYGVFVEVDDGGDAKAAKSLPPVAKA